MANPQIRIDDEIINLFRSRFPDQTGRSDRDFLNWVLWDAWEKYYKSFQPSPTEIITLPLPKAVPSPTPVSTPKPVEAKPVNKKPIDDNWHDDVPD